jgi:hypothetical protein
MAHPRCSFIQSKMPAIVKTVNARIVIPAPCLEADLCGSISQLRHREAKARPPRSLAHPGPNAACWRGILREHGEGQWSQAEGTPAARHCPGVQDGISQAHSASASYFFGAVEFVAIMA